MSNNNINGNSEAQAMAAQYIGETNYGKTEQDIDIDAFNEADDELANIPREELLRELGKDGGGVEEVEGIVTIDEITGEEAPAVPTYDDEAAAIESLQSLDFEETLSKMTELSREHIKIMVPATWTDEQVAEFSDKIEQYLNSKHIQDIEKLTSEQMRLVVGDDVFNHIKKLNMHPLAALKNLLISLKNSLVEKVRIVNAMDELNKAMEFFNSNPQEQVQKTIYAELDQHPELYPTEIHKYEAYLNKYIELLKTQDTNSFIEGEITTATTKIAAITDTLSFTTAKSQIIALKSVIKEGIKDSAHIDKVIIGFIGTLNSDKSLVIQFPVPKNFAPTNDPSDIKKLLSMWILFLEVIIIYRDYPELRDISHADYYKITEMLEGRIEPDMENDGDALLQKLITDNNLTPKVIATAKNLAILFTYILARIFNPKKLNDHTKYVLSYTMAIISNSMNAAYLDITHKLLDTVIFEFIKNDDAK